MLAFPLIRTFLVLYFLGFDCIHLSIFISDVIFSWFWLYPSQHLHFWCDVFLVVTVSISASSFLMWYFLGFDCIHLSIFISDVIFSWFWLSPSYIFISDVNIFLVLTVSISASSFLMWYFLGFDCIHISIFISVLVIRFCSHFISPNMPHHVSLRVLLLFYRSCSWGFLVADDTWHFAPPIPSSSSWINLLLVIVFLKLTLGNIQRYTSNTVYQTTQFQTRNI